jgi:H+/Cl- antiporter ClcA
MPGLRKVPQVMFKTTEMRQPLCFLSPFFCLFSGSILSLFFLFLFLLFLLFFLFLFLFFYVTEGEKQGSGVDSVCGVIKREMMVAR